MNCGKCGNELEKVAYPIRIYKGMGRWKNRTEWKLECKYCIWKGNKGVGKELKDLVSRLNLSSEERGLKNE